MTAEAALSGCTVVEIGVEEAGQYAGRLLASLGARVIKLEPLAGDRTRGLPPFVRDDRGERRSVPHEYLNTGKQSVAVDLDDAFATDLLSRVVGGDGSGARTAVLVAPRHAHRIPDDLDVPVFTVGPHGATGDKAHVPSTSFTRFHAGGSGYLVPAERPTAAGTLAVDCFAGAGIAASVAGVFAMHDADDALAQAGSIRVDFSEQAHAVNLEKMFVGRVSRHGVALTRDSHRYPFGGAVACSDGHVSMLINEKHQWKGFCLAIGQDAWIDDPRYQGGPGRWAMRDPILGALEPWCAARTRDEVLAAMRRHDVPVGAVRTVQEVAASKTMRTRRFVRDVDTPYGRAAVTALPYGDDPLWGAAVRPFAPRLGEHTAAVLQAIGHDDAQIALLENLCLIRCGHANC